MLDLRSAAVALCAMAAAGLLSVATDGVRVLDSAARRLDAPVTVPLRPGLDNRRPFPPVCSFFSDYEFDHRPLPPLLSTAECEGPRVGAPQQIKLVFVGPQEVDVVWSTGPGRVYRGACCDDGGPGEPRGVNDTAGQRIPGRVSSLHLYRGESLVQSLETEGEQYHQVYDGSWAAYNYTSGFIHRARLNGLEPSTEYQYRILPSEHIHSFWTLPRQGDHQRPLRIGIMADGGATWNSTNNLQLQARLGLDLFMHIGDSCYADQHWTNGRVDYSEFKMMELAAKQGAYENMTDLARPRYGTYQPLWDVWGRLIEPLTASVPSLFAVGNHDLERQSDGRMLVAHSLRTGPGRDQSPHFFSAMAGMAHLIFLSSYADFGRSSSQYMWLETELQSVNRTLTPWLIVSFHAPWYNSFSSHYLENECMRLEMEGLLHDAGVDLVLSGHVHTYERSFPAFDFQRDDTGPVYLTVGNGGTLEGIAHEVASAGDGCPRKYIGHEWYQPETCLDSSHVFQGGPESHCPSGQPSWSAHRASFVGSGLLEVLNATHAEWTMYDTSNAGEHVVGDRATIVRAPAEGLCSLQGEKESLDRAPQDDAEGSVQQHVTGGHPAEDRLASSATSGSLATS